MGGRFNTCDHPYCGKPASTPAKEKRGCTHKVCKKHARHSCAKIDDWRKESPALNALGAFGLADLTARLVSIDPPPKISDKEWGNIIDR